MEDEGITQLIIYKQADKTNDLFFFLFPVRVLYNLQNKNIFTINRRDTTFLMNYFFVHMNNYSHSRSLPFA